MEKLNRKSYYKPNPDIIEKMKTIYLGCPKAVNYVKNLNVPEELIDRHIDILYDFARDINYCDKCPGVDNCIKENQFLCTKVVYQDGYLERQLTPCPKLLEKMKLKNQFIVMDFDEDWLNSEISKLNNSAGRKAVIKKYVEYAKKGTFHWIYMTGEQNTGRSYVAATMAVALAKAEKGPIAFVNCSQRFRQLADLNYKNSELFQQLLDKYCSVPVLVLDDFGNEHKNDFERDVILFDILSKRSSNKLFTIFTSDFTIEEIVTLYGTSKPSMIKARQIGRLIKANVKEESNLGEVSVY